MKPALQTQMVNDPFEDPVLYVDFLFVRRALLFDAGNLRRLPTRKLLRVSDVFLTHTHMDHFQDIDWLLRLCLGRDMHINVFGPAGTIARMEHKLQAYTWNLVENYDASLRLTVTELETADTTRSATFRCHRRFVREAERVNEAPEGLLLQEPGFSVRARILDHHVPCLGYRLEEHEHVNVWKNRLEDRGLAVGPWLVELKAAVLRREPDDYPIPVSWTPSRGDKTATLPLGVLRGEVLRITPGLKIAYVVDAGDTPENRAALLDLLADANQAYVECAFLDEDRDLAFAKRHLTALRAGALARTAGVRNLIPVHLSPRYGDRAARLYAEVNRGFLQNQYKT